MATAHMWCERCRQSWLTAEPERLGEAPRCFACGGPLRPERRSGTDRRSGVQRRWDPEERTGADRRAPQPPPEPAP